MPPLDLVVVDPHVSNRQCLIYRAVHNDQVCVFLRDLSSNGTLVNQTLVGCNQWVELKDGDEVTFVQPQQWDASRKAEAMQQEQRKAQRHLLMQESLRMQYGSVGSDKGQEKSMLKLTQHLDQLDNFRGHDGHRQDDRTNNVLLKKFNNDWNQVDKLEEMQEIFTTKNEATISGETLESPRFIFQQAGPRHSTFSQRYTLLDFLGKGHLGKVFSCKENATGELFAVKRHEFPATPSGRGTKESIAAELNLMGLCHKNIMFMKEAFSDDYSSSHVTQLAKGGELFDLLVRKSKLSEGETRHIFRQLFAAVKYLVSII